MHRPKSCKFRALAVLPAIEAPRPLQAAPLSDLDAASNFSPGQRLCHRINNGGRDDQGPNGLAFSLDGKMLAVIHQSGGRIKFFQVGSWTLSGSLTAYSDEARPTHAVNPGRAYSPPPGLGTLAFSQTGNDRGRVHWRRRVVDASAWHVWSR
jgi:hypothetical protein